MNIKKRTWEIMSELTESGKTTRVTKRKLKRSQAIKNDGYISLTCPSSHQSDSSAKPIVNDLPDMPTTRNRFVNGSRKQRKHPLPSQIASGITSSEDEQL